MRNINSAARDFRLRANAVHVEPVTSGGQIREARSHLSSGSPRRFTPVHPELIAHLVFVAIVHVVPGDRKIPSSPRQNKLLPGAGFRAWPAYLEMAPANARMLRPPCSGVKCESPRLVPIQTLAMFGENAVGVAIVPHHTVHLAEDLPVVPRNSSKPESVPPKSDRLLPPSRISCSWAIGCGY